MMELLKRIAIVIESLRVSAGRLESFTDQMLGAGPEPTDRPADNHPSILGRLHSGVDALLDLVARIDTQLERLEIEILNESNVRPATGQELRQAPRNLMKEFAEYSAAQDRGLVP